jgi:uncharacterized protein YnzC (UPF0291/DUF896 family)
VKDKKCKICNNVFKPQRSLQRTCSLDCAIVDARKKTADKKVKEIKRSLLTRSDYLKGLQAVFNTFIRLRDAGNDCISCGQNMQGKKGDASHFFSVGAYPHLRFNEDNVHLSCVHCNQYLSGNIHEYRYRLPNKIGKARFEQLEHEAFKGQPLKLTIEEIKEKTEYYKNYIKKLKQ